MTEQLFKQVTNDDGSVCYVPVESDEKVERWKPSSKGGYFFVTEDGMICPSPWNDDIVDNARWEHGNYFRASTDAQHMSKDQYIRNMIFHACKMVEPDYEFRVGRNNFYPEAGRVDLEVGVTGDYQHRSPAFVSSSKNARKIMALLKSWGVL